MCIVALLQQMQRDSGRKKKTNNIIIIVKWSQAIEKYVTTIDDELLQDNPFVGVAIKLWPYAQDFWFHTYLYTLYVDR
jgi:hypothetical protein